MAVTKVSPRLRACQWPAEAGTSPYTARHFAVAFRFPPTTLRYHQTPVFGEHPRRFQASHMLFGVQRKLASTLHVSKAERWPTFVSASGQAMAEEHGWRRGNTVSCLSGSRDTIVRTFMERHACLIVHSKIGEACYLTHCNRV